MTTTYTPYSTQLELFETLSDPLVLGNITNAGVLNTINYNPLTSSNITVASNTSGSYPGSWNTTTITSNIPNITLGNLAPWESPSSLHVNGKANFEDDIDVNGNIKVNGVNILEALENIEKRLNIVRFNLEKEERWQDLKELGEKYRALEAECIERDAIWDALKS